VRELRNAVERACLLPNHPQLGFEAPPKKEGAFGDVDIDVPFKVAKQKLVDEFDRRYLEALLEAHDNNISAAARAAGIERMSIYKMIRRLGLDKTEEREGASEDEADITDQRG
jgi:two-component system, NtrC family, response regulator GlrR